MELGRGSSWSGEAKLYEDVFQTHCGSGSVARDFTFYPVLDMGEGLGKGGTGSDRRAYVHLTEVPLQSFDVITRVQVRRYWVPLSKDPWAVSMSAKVCRHSLTPGLYGHGLNVRVPAAICSSMYSSRYLAHTILSTGCYISTHLLPLSLKAPFSLQCSRRLPFRLVLRRVKNHDRSTDKCEIDTGGDMD